jgi:hypothetical protein
MPTKGWERDVAIPQTGGGCGHLLPTFTRSVKLALGVQGSADGTERRNASILADGA